MSDVHEAVKRILPTSCNTGPAHSAFLTWVMRIQEYKLSRHRSFQKGVSHVIDWKQKWQQYFSDPPTTMWSGFASPRLWVILMERQTTLIQAEACTLVLLFLGSSHHLKNSTLYCWILETHRLVTPVAPHRLPDTYVTSWGPPSLRKSSSWLQPYKQIRWIQQKNFPAEPSPNCWPLNWCANKWLI